MFCKEQLYNFILYYNNYYESKYNEEMVKKNYLLVDGKVELLDKILNHTDKQPLCFF